MSKRSVDTSTSFSTIAYKALPNSREVEDSEVDPIPEKDPRKKQIYKEPYLPDDKLVEAVNLAIALAYILHLTV